MSVADYIRQLLGYEEYAFSWDELREKSSKSDIALKRELSRLVDKGEIINLRKGFYIIMPPPYQNLGQLPIELYINKLFRHLKRPYYLALYTASRFHGASHQQIHKDYVMASPPPVLDINKPPIEISFFTASNWPEKNIIRQKSDAGLFNISSPALTAVDLIYHQTKIGGINRMLANLEELGEEIEQGDLNDLLTWYPHKSTLQRLGFLLEEHGANELCVDRIYEYLSQEEYYPVLLSPQKGQKPGSTGNRWKIDVNLKLESDL